MLRGLAGQFSILFVPGHRYYRDLLFARLISALGTWTAFFAVRIALYQQTHSPIWITVLLFCELAPGVILGIAVGPLIDRWPRQRDDDPLRSRRRRRLRRAAVRAQPRRDLRRLRLCRLLGSVLPARVLLGDPESGRRGRRLGRERAHAGRGEPRDARSARSLAALGVITIGAHAVYGLNAAQLPRLGAAARSHRQPSPVGPCRPASAGPTGGRWRPASRSSATTATSRRSS